jgi:hypothetical protein
VYSAVFAVCRIGQRIHFRGVRHIQLMREYRSTGMLELGCRSGQRGLFDVG